MRGSGDGPVEGTVGDGGSGDGPVEGTVGDGPVGSGNSPVEGTEMHGGSVGDGPVGGSSAGTSSSSLSSSPAAVAAAAVARSSGSYVRPNWILPTGVLVKVRTADGDVLRAICCEHVDCSLESRVAGIGRAGFLAAESDLLGWLMACNDHVAARWRGRPAAPADLQRPRIESAAASSSEPARDPVAIASEPARDPAAGPAPDPVIDVDAEGNAAADHDNAIASPSYASSLYECVDSDDDIFEM